MGAVGVATTQGRGKKPKPKPSTTTTRPTSTTTTAGTTTTTVPVSDGCSPADVFESLPPADQFPLGCVIGAGTSWAVLYIRGEDATGVPQWKEI